MHEILLKIIIYTYGKEQKNNPIDIIHIKRLCQFVDIQFRTDNLWIFGDHMQKKEKSESLFPFAAIFSRGVFFPPFYLDAWKRQMGVSLNILCSPSVKCNQREYISVQNLFVSDMSCQKPLKDTQFLQRIILSRSCNIIVPWKLNKYKNL